MRKLRSNKEESDIYISQEVVIKNRYGKEAADKANYGWGVDDCTVQTKVYGHGVLISWYEGDKMIHSWG